MPPTIRPPIHRSQVRIADFRTSGGARGPPRLLRSRLGLPSDAPSEDRDRSASLLPAYDGSVSVLTSVDAAAYRTLTALQVRALDGAGVPEGWPHEPCSHAFSGHALSRPSARWGAQPGRVAPLRQRRSVEPPPRQQHPRRGSPPALRRPGPPRAGAFRDGRGKLCYSIALTISDAPPFPGCAGRGTPHDARSTEQGPCGTRRTGRLHLNSQVSSKNKGPRKSLKVLANLQNDRNCRELSTNKSVVAKFVSKLMMPLHSQFVS